ncbi:cyclodeaminase/cyclohydrolase family protein [uncultured Clostridium sp.]|jgi:formiminotetrahydrofolate cyclodeaminase|uniref:cyclodeaminase/cyclohydrolase family protein n=1 Tax=uncultured Clostridium sp. TaxID=59620 RepID=UPI002606696C|nr:cyclodeaminase/cyclohydrolase family protein [uncultured Clostridium sp.]
MNNQKIEEFILDLASEKPAPGGGAVAAIVASLAGALSSMVYSLTVGKKVYEELSEDDKILLNENVEEAKGFYMEALKFAKKDGNAFNALMGTYKLPKETDEEKKRRTHEIEKKTLECMIVPLSLAEESLSFYKNIMFAAEKGNKNLVSDAAIAAIMLHAAIESSIINVKVNLNFIKDADIQKSVGNKLRIIEENNNIMKMESMNVINKYL